MSTSNQIGRKPKVSNGTRITLYLEERDVKAMKAKAERVRARKSGADFTYQDAIRAAVSKAANTERARS